MTKGFAAPVPAAKEGFAASVPATKEGQRLRSLVHYPTSSNVSARFGPKSPPTMKRQPKQQPDSGSSGDSLPRFPRPRKDSLLRFPRPRKDLLPQD
ncbi:hypothetical protein quinque_014535 [Culex quinquefasciatus]